MIAARRRELRRRAFCLAHMAIFDVPLVIMCVGGEENGRLRRDVTKDKRRRRFFFLCIESVPSPSTSESRRLRFG